MNYSKYDEEFARSIDKQLNCTGISENAVLPKESGKENYKPRTLVDETLEYIDPTPNIYTLFVQFNEKFFWNVLLPVQVKWSPRMTSCAGICSFHPRNRECVISLSTPLLKLRPRKDLIETLLHEMIHAYLFLTNDNRDRDGHGPVFQSHMKRINKEAGTNITIYHSFHEEVRLYKQHWWRCNGPCHKRAPFFGTVRRAMNRAPGPNDFWWKEHQLTCNGQFIKIKEPEKPVKPDKGKRKSSSGSSSSDKNSVLNWINKNGGSQNPTKSQVSQNPPKSQVSQNPPKSSMNSTSVANFQTDLKKLGNSTNNVHGWGTGGPGSSSASESSGGASTSKSRNSLVSFSGTVGGSGSGKSVLLNLYADSSKSSSKNSSGSNTRKSNIKDGDFFDLTKDANPIVIPKHKVSCPSCSKLIEEQKINQHLDSCLDTESTPNKKRAHEDEDGAKSSKVFKSNTDEGINCPLCDRKQKPDEFNDHLDNCLQGEEFKEEIDSHNASSSSIKLQDSPNRCLICNKVLRPGETLNDHLEDCVASVFNDTVDEDESSFDLPKKSIEEEKEDKVALDSYPCPICMSLVKESQMNEHLDGCLATN